MFKAKNGKIYLYDTIDVPGSGGVSGLDVIDALDSFDGGDVEIHINSPGGSVFEGISIYNSLKSYPGKVTTYNDSVAASISSIIFLAGEERQAAPGSFFMMHNAWSHYGGNAEELRKHAELLELCRAAATRGEWDGRHFDPWRDAVPDLEQQMQELESHAGSLDHLSDALRLVIQIESSEVNGIYLGIVAASDSEFVRSLRVFHRAGLGHVSYICEKIPEIDPELRDACRNLRDAYSHASARG